MITQKELFDYLKANPLNVKVHYGDLEELGGEDYIFVDLINDNLIGFDDKGIYKTTIQITIATTDYDNRNTLTNYVKDFINVSCTYDRQNEYQYFIAILECEVIFNG